MKLGRSCLIMGRGLTEVPDDTSALGMHMQGDDHYKSRAAKRKIVCMMTFLCFEFTVFGA